jgi:hypothetical protein
MKEINDFLGGGEGCQIFLDTIYQNGEKYTKIATK